MKKRLGLCAAGLLVLAVLVPFAVFNINGPAGNLFTGSPTTQLLLYGRLCGILAALIFLFQMLSMGRNRLLDRVFGKPFEAVWHRRLGFFTALLLALHIGLILAGRSILYEESAWTVARDFFRTPDRWGLLAGIGVLLLIFILGSAGLFVWKKISFGVWKKTHYFVYAAVPLVFFHQVFYGFDFSGHPWFKWFWIVMFCLVMLEVAVWRIRSTFLNGGK